MLFRRLHLVGVYFLINIHACQMTPMGGLIGHEEGQGDDLQTGLPFDSQVFRRNLDFSRKQVSESSFPKKHSVSSTKNCTKCLKTFHISLAEKIRIQQIKHTIRRELGRREKEKIGNKRGSNIQAKQLKPPTDPLEKPQKEEQINDRQYSEISHIISYSSANAVNGSEKNVISFEIDNRSDQGYIEAMGAQLWLLLRKRQRRNSRGKKIFLNVFHVHDGTRKLLTNLMTRVKRTKWQRVTLPVTFIQAMLDSNERKLNIKITCQRCGKMVRPVLYKRRRGMLKKNRRRKHRRRLRNKQLSQSQRKQPFLIIRTRFRHIFEPLPASNKSIM